VPIPPEQYVEWFEPVQANVAAHLANDGSWFVNIKASTTPDSLSTELYVLDLVMAHARRWGWHLATEFCWERAGVPKEPTLRFKNQFEPVYQFTRGRWKFRPIHVQHLSDYAVTAMGVGAGNTSWGDPSSDTVSQGQHGDMFDDRRGLGLAYPGNRLPTFAGSHEALGHGAAFPIGLPEFFVKAYTDRGDVVFDPFVGSGSTLMACENQARKGRGIDLSPGYVDVTCRRFQDVTGIIPVLEATGKPHDFSL
jgi:site-specific DNA-methyltransferase (adenine-specific)